MLILRFSFVIALMAIFAAPAMAEDGGLNPLSSIVEKVQAPISGGAEDEGDGEDEGSEESDGAEEDEGAED